MLYSLIACLVAGVAFVAVYRLGLRDGMAKGNGREIAPMVAVQRKSKPQKLDKWDTVLANIDRYDGTASGQKEVK